MKRITLLTIFLICIVLLIAGCSNTQEEVPTGDLPSMIMVEGEIWMNTKNEVSVEIDESAAIGEITFYVQSNEIPSVNGQANFEIAGSKYAYYEDNIDSIIEKVFNESGINDTKKIEAAKSKLTISNF